MTVSEEQDMDDAAGGGIRPIDVTARARRIPDRSRVTDVRGHGADAGWGNSVGERRGELHDRRATQREGFGRCADQ